eukprot:scaffold579_cov146-Ochromonas_danica.AAC.6
MAQGFADDETYLLAIRCVSLAISSKTVFNNIGLLTNLYVRATKSPAVKNERRWIKLSQSEPFDIAGRPTTLNFGLVYTSEVFEDCPDIAPSLLARIRRNDGKDSKLRLSVYYSSNLTGGKEVLLSTTAFSERELLRAAGEMSSEMSTEYCTGPRAYLQIIPHLPALIESTILPIAAPRRPKNPLSQRYVFYAELDPLTPYLDGDEQTWEPRFSGLLPVLFLSYYLSALERSIAAWQARQEAERLRQGRFHSDSEAFRYGWHKIEVTVRAARFGCMRILPRRQISASAPAAAHLAHFPFGTDYFTELPPTFSSPSASSESSQPPLGVENAHFELCSSPNARNARRVKKGSTRSAPRPANLAVKKVDESVPSSFVEISVEDREKIFLQPLGRTNTEYFTSFPVYGSNLNAPHARKANSQAVVADDTTSSTLEEVEHTFCSYEVVSKDFVPRRWRFAPQTLCADGPSSTSYHSSGAEDGTGVSAIASVIGSSASVSSSGPSPTVSSSLQVPSITPMDPEDDQFLFTAVNGRSVTFHRYVPSASASLRLDLCLESNTSSRRVGAAFLSLAQNLHTKTWVGVALAAEELSSLPFDCAEILVEVTLTSPSSAPCPYKASDRMDEVFVYDRPVDGRLEENLGPDYRSALADCYEWLWALGYAGHDPLVDDAEDKQSKRNSSIIPQAVVPANDVAATQPQMGPDLMTKSYSDDVVSVPTKLERSLSAGDLVGAGRVTGGNPSGRSRFASMKVPDSDDEEEAEVEALRASLRLKSSSNNLQGPEGEEQRQQQFEDTDEYRAKEQEEQDIADLLEEMNFQEYSNMLGKKTHEHEQKKYRKLRSRTDFVYPLDWIQKHIEALQQVATEVRDLLSSLRLLVAKEDCFRPSALKKDFSVQALPINLHYQLLGVRRHRTASEKEGVGESAAGVVVLHSVTCGALSPHMLGHKKGGLYGLEGQLAAQKKAILHGRDNFKWLVNVGGGWGLHRSAPLLGSAANGGSAGKGGEAYDQLQRVGRDLLEFETFCVSVGRRKMYALAQGLSVAVNALLLKLNLVIAGRIPGEVAVGWLQHGFLVVFEGLLSVIGSERSMLEDTLSAVHALRAFQVRVVQQNEDEIALKQNVQLRFSGREVVLALSPVVLSTLPQAYSSPKEGESGTVLRFVTVLFTQGIDIQQTMVTTFGRGQRSVDLQHRVNSLAFEMLNQYCFHFRPIDGANWGSECDEHIHPFMQSLYNALRSASPSAKNVDLLVEVERISVLLEGVRVTFCKSGNSLFIVLYTQSTDIVWFRERPNGHGSDFRTVAATAGPLSYRTVTRTPSAGRQSAATVWYTLSCRGEEYWQGSLLHQSSSSAVPSA